MIPDTLTFTNNPSLSYIQILWRASIWVIPVSIMAMTIKLAIPNAA